MTYDQILTIESIVEFGSFKAAAKALHKSQPSLSVAIKNLEEEFRIQIFDRSQYRPRLTEAGEIFYHKALKALKTYRELEQLGLQLGKGIDSTINICAEAIFPISTIAPTLRKFFDPHVHTTLNLNIDVLEGVMSKLKNQQVDLALGPSMSDDPALERSKILEVKMIPVIARDLPINDIDFLKTFPQIVVESSVKEQRSIVFGAVSEQFWSTSDLFMKEQLISSGLGWGRLPEHQVFQKLEAGSLIQIECEEVPCEFVPMYVLKLRDKILGPNTQNLWKYLSQSY